MRKTLAIFVLSAAAFVAAHPAMLGWGGEVRAPGWDATRVFWADLAFARHAFAQGTLPLWNPFDRGGYPFVAEPQSGMFDPVTLLLVGVALLLGHAPAVLIVIKAVLHYGIAGSGMAAFLREQKLPPWAVTYGTALLLLCPRMDKLKDQSALWPTAWVGWLLLALERCLCRPGLRRGLWLGVATGLVINAGYPPTAFRLALLLLPYAAWRVVVTARAHSDRRAYFGALARALGVAVLVAGLLSAAQVWATLAVLPQTQRVQLPLSDIVASHTVPGHWRGLFAPLASKTGLLVYGGLASVVGVLATLVLRPRARPLLLVAVGMVGFVLACGENLPVLPALASVPGFRSFRIAGHYLTLVALAVVVLAPMGLARLARPDAPRWLGPGLATVAFFGWGLFTTRNDPLAGVVAVGAALTVGAMTLVPPAKRSIMGWAVVVALVADLLVMGRPVANILQPLPDPAPGHRLAQTLPHPLSHRVADYGYAGRRPGPREAVRDLVGHRPALTDPRYLKVYRDARLSPRLLAAMNVGVVGYEQSRAGRRGGLEEVEGETPGLYRVPKPWPLASWTSDVRIVDGPDAAAADLRRPGLPRAVFDVRDVGEAIEPLRELAAAPAPAPPVPATVHGFGLDRLEIAVEAPQAGVVVIAEGYDPYWEAWLNGERVPLLRTNLIVRAVAVPAGSHRLSLRYRPPGVVGLWLLWALTWLGIATVAGHGWWSRRRASG